MRIAVILITVLILMIIPIVLGGWLIKPEDVSSSACGDCHNIEEIGIFTTTGASISNEYNWQRQLHQALENPDCLACHFIPGDELAMFQHELLKASWKGKCALCHIDSIPDDTIHSTAGENCGVCHSPQAWSDVSIEHDQFFRLDSRHETTCDNCHIVAGDFFQYSCYEGCHEHTLAEIKSKHLEEGVSDYQDCAECHRRGNVD